MITRFNIRVYFILYSDDRKKILVADEIIRQKFYTKFPGGGLEFGEGLIDGARREAIEELGQEIDILEHIYTTDFFIRSFFNPGDQVISVYYTAKLRESPGFRISEKKNDFLQFINNEESFRWISLGELDPKDFELPADKKVVERLLAGKCHVD